MIFESVIYKDEIDSCFTEIALERALNESSLLFDILYFENTNDKSTTEKFKSMINKIIEAFKAFIIKCKDYLKNAVNKITNRITDAYTEYKLKDIFNSFDTSITKAEKLGIKSFKYIDMKALFNCLDDECNMYEKVINKFSRDYIKRGAPKDAEKMLHKFKEISEKYDTKLKSILNETKEFSIHEAKQIVIMMQNCKSIGTGGYTNIVDKHTAMCDDIEKFMISTLKSLEKYSEETGYIQNAKTLQQMIHNSCVQIHTHSAECITSLIRHGIPIICNIDEIAHAKASNNSDETTSNKRELVRNIASTVSNTVGVYIDNTVKSEQKVARKNDVKDWKYTKGESPLTFSKRELTDDEELSAIKKASLKTTFDIGSQLAGQAFVKGMSKKVQQKISK